MVTCRVVNGTTTVLNSNGGIFPKVSVNEMLRSIQYTDLCQTMVSDCSMRSAAEKIQRVSHYECNHRTLDDWSEREGCSIAKQVQEQAREVLIENGFDTEKGTPVDGVVLRQELVNPDIITILPEDVAEAIRKYNENRADEDKISDRWVDHPYVLAPDGINISIDDVGVTEQKSTGRAKGSPPKEHKKRVENTVIHIQQGLGTYILTGLGMRPVVISTLAFLLKNDLLENRALTFFVDGATNIKNSIQTVFCWRPYDVVLDWHHLYKKCAERLSLIMRGSILRNETLKQLARILWRGALDEAIAFLNLIPDDKIKSNGSYHRNNLIDYLNRNRDNIPCYALRKELGLRNSSNLVEKANDRVVAVRQKNKGMSWSRSGSTALANIRAMRINGESLAWNFSRQLRFSLNYNLKDAA